MSNTTTHSRAGRMARGNSTATHESTLSQSEADPENHTSIPEQPEPREVEAPAPTFSEQVTTVRMGAHYAGLVPMAMFGVLIRLGLEALATYNGQSIFALAWAQAVGCAIMGTALHRKGDIVRVYPPLYTALTTGLAGSVTTFSSWMLGGFEAFSDIGGYNRHGLHDTVDGVAYSVVTFAIAIAALTFGEHLSSISPSLSRFHLPPQGLEPSSSRSASTDSELQNGNGEEKIKSRHLKEWKYPDTPILDWCTIILAGLFYIGAGLLYALGPRSWRYEVTFALLLGPPGAILRFFLAKINTKTAFIDRFPLGTFIANIFATAVLSAGFAASNAPRSGSRLTTVGCNAMQGLEQGFCGCLSTVSTFAVESRTIRDWRWKWSYVGGSIVLGHFIVLAIVGGTKWSSAGLGAACRGG